MSEELNETESGLLSRLGKNQSRANLVLVYMDMRDGAGITPAGRRVILETINRIGKRYSEWVDYGLREE